MVAQDDAARLAFSMRSWSTDLRRTLEAREALAKVRDQEAQMVIVVTARVEALMETTALVETTALTAQRNRLTHSPT